MAAKRRRRGHGVMAAAAAVVPMVVASTTAAAAAAIARHLFALLLLLGGLAARTQHAQSAREHLASGALDNGNNMTSVQRSLVVVDLLFFDQQQRLALDFNIVIFLLRR